MAQVEDIIEAIKQLQQEHAVADMRRKPDVDPAYVLGHAQGKFQAFSLVVERIESILEKEDERESVSEKD